MKQIPSQYSNYLTTMLQQQKLHNSTINKRTDIEYRNPHQNANHKYDKAFGNTTFKSNHARNCRTPNHLIANAKIGRNQSCNFAEQFNNLEKEFAKITNLKAKKDIIYQEPSKREHSPANDKASEEENLFITNLKAKHEEAQIKLPSIEKQMPPRLRTLMVKRINGEYLMYGMKYQQYANGIIKEKSNQLIMILQEIDIIREKLDKVNNILRSGISVQHFISTRHYSYSTS